MQTAGNRSERGIEVLGQQVAWHRSLGTYDFLATDGL